MCRMSGHAYIRTYVCMYMIHTYVDLSVSVGSYRMHLLLTSFVCFVTIVICMYVRTM